MSLLRARCAGEPRLRWRNLPWPRKGEHGQALNLLFAADDQPYFCFMDSDILATGDFMAELLPAMSGAAGLFSAWPITIKAEERMLSDVCSFIGGRHSHTTAGLCLGGSYFAIYERATLAHALAATPDGFNRGYWAQLPQRTRQFLRGIGQERRFYDTGRVLNLYLQSQSGALHVQHTTALLHLGSYSIYAGSAQHAVPRWRRLAQAALRRVRNRLNGQTYRDAVLHQVAQDPVQRSVDQRRARLVGYFARLAAALAAGEALPEPIELQDAELDDNVKRATAILAMAQSQRQEAEKLL
ncbi:MAG: hypothetical protein EOM24_15605 [Chloroflexia bacterium]|nr:hypothetical protein [Chloroflexia bacterium]